MTMRPSIVATLRRYGRESANSTPGDYRAYRKAVAYARRMFNPESADDAVYAAEHGDAIPLAWVRANIP